MDIKRVIAYSTMSHMGMVCWFILCSQSTAATHTVGHGFIKSGVYGHTSD